LTSRVRARIALEHARDAIVEHGSRIERDRRRVRARMAAFVRRIEAAGAVGMERQRPKICGVKA